MLTTILLALQIAMPMPEKLFAKENLTAWCIVPFDAKKRGPEERVAMLKRLGFTRFAYDWRTEHLPTFDRELALLQEAGIELTAVWFPGGLDKDSRFILDTLKKHNVKTQLWVMVTDPAPGRNQAAKVAAGVAFLRPIAEEAAKYGHTVALYNHGGWGGEPENQLAIIHAIQNKNVGIVYNLHHGHNHRDRLPKLLKSIMPHLVAVNINGMTYNGEKIRIVGTGENDVSVLKAICNSGYHGPIGILGHTADDVEDRLKDNLDGLAWLIPQLAGQPAEAAPVFRTGSKAFAMLSADQQTIEIFGTTGKIREWKIVVDHNTDTALPALLGTFQSAHGILRFEPRFPFSPGVRYRIQGPGYSQTVTIPKRELIPSATVTAIYPTADKLPENTLRLYIHFSHPMMHGNVYQYITLLDDRNEKVKWPFLQLDEELWSPDGKRFTLLFDPGRQKQGLKPREELGPSLVAGRKYTVVIDKNWCDETNTVMKESFRKTFEALAPDHEPIDPMKWKITPPTRTGNESTPLDITFEKSLDHALAQRMIHVVGPDGNRIAGAVSLNAGERKWRFRPTSNQWSNGKYKIVINKELEDVCGNRIGKAFEVDVFEPADVNNTSKHFERSFVVK